MNQPIRFTTEARGLSGYQTPAELNDAKEVMSVALAQPHRRGDNDPRLESALGRLCKAKGWHSASFDAGIMYGDNIRRMRLAEGFKVPCVRASEIGEPITDEMRERYKQRVREADFELAGIKRALPSVIVALCWDDRDQDASWHGMIAGGLVKLALHYGLRKMFHDPS